MDVEEPDLSALSAAALRISETRRAHLFRMLAESGYIDGVRTEDGAAGLEVFLIAPRITLAGLEYLEENGLMRRAYRLAKGIKDITPGM